MNDDEYVVQCRQLENSLRHVLTPQFLQTLVKAMRTAGWDQDHVEVAQFVEWCYDIAGVPCPEEMDPFIQL